MYVSAKNIREHGVDTTNITYVSEDIHKEIYSRCNPEKGDILLIKDGATAGIVTMNNLEEEFSLLSSVGLLKTSIFVYNSYVVWAIRSDNFQQHIRSVMKGTGIPRITLEIIGAFLIPIPPLKEQERIVKQLETIIERIETMEDVEWQ